MRIGYLGQFAFAHTDYSTDSLDTGIARDSAGVLRVTNGGGGAGALKCTTVQTSLGVTWDWGAASSSPGLLADTAVQVKIGGVTYNLLAHS